MATVAAAAGFAGAALLAPAAHAVVGGRVAEQTYPWMANITLAFPDEDLHICGASMITQQWAVTAAHCVKSEQEDLPLDQAVVRVGSNDRTNGGHARQIVRVVTHPDFTHNDDRDIIADIALIQLSAPVDVQPVGIARNTSTPGTRTRLLGWGNTCGDPVPACDENPTRLHEVDTRVTATGNCANIGTAELCVGNPASGRGACHGDSGGPQLIAAGYGQWMLGGVTSRVGRNGASCADAATVYTSVPSHRAWIENTVAGPAPV